MHLNNSILTTKFEKKIISHCTEQNTKHYWYKRMRIPAEAQQYVNWATFKKTSTLLSSHKQLFIMKHSAGIAAIGQNMVRRKERTTDACPRCGSVDKHTEHIIQCPNENAEKAFNTAIANLETWLTKRTTVEIETVIKDLILEYRENQAPSTIENESVELQQARNRQRMVRLHPFLCGFLCMDWVTLQNTHLTKIGSRRCAKRWAAQLSGKLIEIIFDMWNHRNKILHKTDNNIMEQEQNELNNTIQTIYSDLPNM